MKAKAFIPINDFNLAFIRDITAFYIGIYLLQSAEPLHLVGPGVYISLAFIWINTIHAHTHIVSYIRTYTYNVESTEAKILQRRLKKKVQ